MLGRVCGEVFAVDSKMGRTLRPLFTRPGFLTREFNEGRRAGYTAPFKLYVLSSLLLFLCIGIQRQMNSWSQPIATIERPTAEDTKGSMRFDLGNEEGIRVALGEDSWAYGVWSRQRDRFGTLKSPVTLAGDSV